jgi:hypothetical protein
LQSALQELFSLLALLNPAKYPSLGDFVRQYGELRGAFKLVRFCGYTAL